MAKKGLLAQIYAERKRAQRLREQEARRHERELEQARLKEERAEAARQRKEEVAERARVRKAEQAEREKAAAAARRAREREQQAERAEKQKARLQEQKEREAEKLRIRRETERAKERERRLAVAERERARKEALKVKAAEQRRERERARAEAQAEVARLDAEAQRRTDEIVQLVDDINSTLAQRHLNLASRLADVHLADDDPTIPAMVLALLAESDAPSGNGEREVEYDSTTLELLIKYDLPRQDVIPKIETYKHLRSRKEIRAVARKAPAVVGLYETLVAQTAVRVIAEVFAAVPSDRVGTIVLNGHVSSVDAGTGHPIQPSILSVLAKRDDFEAFNLDAVDAVACLHNLNAIVSPHPFDLVPVRPVWTFDPSRYKFVQERDVVAGLDHRPNLLDLTPSEFEHLVRRLYEAMGLKAWVTQASKDDGVDAIAVKEDAAMFGKCVIQAKRYKIPVDAESVYALAGVMEAHKASTGILVTTSYFGSGSKRFAEQHGRMQLHDGRNLKQMLQQHLNLDVLIDLEKMPAGWHPSDVGKLS